MNNYPDMNVKKNKFYKFQMLNSCFLKKKSVEYSDIIIF